VAKGALEQAQELKNCILHVYMLIKQCCKKLHGKNEQKFT